MPNPDDHPFSQPKSVQDALKQLAQPKECTANVDGVKVVLHSPPPAAICSFQVAIAKSLTEDSPEGMLMEACAATLPQCVEGASLTEDEWKRIVVDSKFGVSELFQALLFVCGLKGVDSKPEPDEGLPGENPTESQLS